MGNISRVRLNFIYHEAKRAEKTGSDSSKYGFTLGKTHNLSCAFVISKKMKLDRPIHLNEVYTHWTRLKFSDDGVMKDGNSNISCMTE